MSEQLGYGINPQDSEVKSLQLLPGIHENVMMTNIAAEGARLDGTGDPVLRFYFENQDGLKFNHTEFQITREGCANFAAKTMGKMTTEEVMSKEFKEQGQRIFHILKCFVPIDQLDITAGSWEEYRKALINVVGISYTDIPLKMKIVYNNKDFISFPKTPKSPFCLRMDDPAQLVLTKYDRVVPLPAVAPTYGNMDNPEDGAIQPAKKW